MPEPIGRKVVLARTVLVVDDVPENRSLIHAFLEPVYDVLEAEDGDQAIQILASRPVDLVLLDVMMPGRSGYEVCREIKAQPRPVFLPVLLLTALHEQEQRNAGLAAGADDFLTKPVDRRELLLRVRIFLRLREQEEKLRRHQALKDDLFALVLHDVRNPLAGVLGFMGLHKAELAAKGPVPEEVKLAMAAALRLRELLEDVLEVRLLEDAELPIRLETASLRVAAADATLTVAGAARAKRVRVEVVAAGEPIGLFDRKLVRRCLENLLINAIKHSPAGGAVALTVCRAQDDVIFEVADDGPGVPDGLKGSLFEKFGSLEVKRGEERRGFGLGLHLVKLVATGHGGAASVRDRPGGGSIFRIQLPQGGAPAAVMAPAAAPSSPAAGTALGAPATPAPAMARPPGPPSGREAPPCPVDDPARSS